MGVVTGGGGGGGTTFNGGTITTPLEVKTDSTPQFLATLANGTEKLAIYAGTSAGQEVMFVEDPAGNFNRYLVMYAAGQHMEDPNGATHVDITNDQLNLGNGALLILKTGGAILVTPNAAPADALISNGQAALWFDKTNGAAALIVKAKQSNGTVVTGSLALT